MNDKERGVLAKYAHWKSVLGSHGLADHLPSTTEKFQEINSCDGVGGCVADSCSGGNGEGCLADTCSADVGDDHHKFISNLVNIRQARPGKPKQVDQ